MKHRLLLSFVLALFSCALSAQVVERIKADPAWLWAEGSAGSPAASDDAALSALIMKLAATDLLQVPPSSRLRIWQTYLSDIRDRSETVIFPGGALRYIAWRDIPSVFESRWRKVHELTQSAEHAVRQGNADVARTYCSWAETYLSSLPEGETSLREEISSLRAILGSGQEVQLHIRNVETEVAAIRRALAVGSAKPLPTPLASVVSPNPENGFAEPSAAASMSSREPMEMMPLMLPLVSAARRTSLPALPERDLRTTPLRQEPVSEAYLPAWSVFPMVELGRIPAYGVMLTRSGRRWGAYASFRYNFVDGRPDYSCTRDGHTDWGYIWASGNTRSSRISISGGASFRAWDRLGFFGGAGYGRGTVLWEDSTGKWASVSDFSQAGILVEAGAQIFMGDWVVTAGCSSIKFRELSALLGVGWRF